MSTEKNHIVISLHPKNGSVTALMLQIGFASRTKKNSPIKIQNLMSGGSKCADFDMVENFEEKDSTITFVDGTVFSYEKHRLTFKSGDNITTLPTNEVLSVSVQETDEILWKNKEGK